MQRHFFCGLLLGCVFTFGPAYADDPPPNVFHVVDFMKSLRDYIGQSLLSSTVDMVNTTSGLTLQNLVPQGAAFSSGDKNSGQTVDQLRAVSLIAVAITTCAGANSLDAKVSHVSIWEVIPPPQPNQTDPDGRAQMALGLEQVLQAMQNPPSIQTPGTLRAPADGFHGLTFEYTQGDRTESLSFLNEDASDADSSLKIMWSATDTAVCPTNSN